MKPAVETRPHDFRVVCGGYPPPVVVGGQAVNIWALTYLPEVPQNSLVSADLDIVVDPEGHARLKHLPQWVYEANETRSWTDARLAFLKGVSVDGRPLLVEVCQRRDRTGPIMAERKGTGELDLLPAFQKQRSTSVRVDFLPSG